MRFPVPYRNPFSLPSVALLAAAAVLAGIPVTAYSQGDDWGSSARRLRAAVSLPPSLLAGRIHGLKRRAGSLYREGRYEEAGRFYSEIASLDPSDASVRNDLGLCYLKRGMRDSALAATREALLLADPSLAAMDPSSWSFPDLRARKSAYFNLDKLGVPMKVPAAGQCETWSSLSACGERLHVCAEAGRRPEGEGTLHWEILRVGLTRERALFNYEEVEIPSLLPYPEMRDMEELAIDGSPESKARWINRDSSATLPLGRMLETADSSCTGNCGRLERSLSECRVIHFDPCAGAVGVACAQREDGGKDRILIGEYYLIPAGQVPAGKFPDR